MRSLSLFYVDGSCDDITFSSEDSIEKVCQETFDLLSITLDQEKKNTRIPQHFAHLRSLSVCRMSTPWRHVSVHKNADCAPV